MVCIFNIEYLMAHRWYGPVCRLHKLSMDSPEALVLAESDLYVSCTWDIVDEGEMGWKVEVGGGDLS